MNSPSRESLPQSAATEAIILEATVINKIAWRILPLATIAYCVAFIDRTNVAVAALTMNKDLGFTAT
ncbi:MAG: MFS transporter, partial [Hyphomicrobiales bacterium]|nr:MFS transporter [Hyphomicrobiales bacterium]